jgi:hypothetical protein
MSAQHYPALWQFLGAYLHQDWREEYESPSAALRDFQVLASTADDAALEELLVKLGGSFVPSRAGQNPRDWLRRLEDEAQLLAQDQE